MTALLWLLTSREGRLLGAVALIGGLFWLHGERAYDRGYAARSAEVRAATDDLNADLSDLQRKFRQRGDLLQEIESDNDDLERQLAAERAASDDDSAWSLERVRRYNRAGRIQPD